MRANCLTQLFLIGMVLLFNACTEKDELKPEPNPTNNNNTPLATGTLLFHLHTFIDENEVDAYNIGYTTGDGRAISLSMAQFYISEIELEQQDGSFYKVSDKILLKTLEIESYQIGKVPVGQYKSLRFKVGLPPATSASLSNDSAVLKRPEMSFSNGDYIFLNAKGSVDTSTDMSGKMCPFVYEIGGNDYYKQVIMPQQPFSIATNQAYYIHMYADYSRLFSGIALNSSALSLNTSIAHDTTFANKMAINITTMFKYE